MRNKSKILNSVLSEARQAEIIGEIAGKRKWIERQVRLNLENLDSDDQFGNVSDDLVKEVIEKAIHEVRRGRYSDQGRLDRWLKMLSEKAVLSYVRSLG